MIWIKKTSTYLGILVVLDNSLPLGEEGDDASAALVQQLRVRVCDLTMGELHKASHHIVPPDRQVSYDVL